MPVPKIVIGFARSAGDNSMIGAVRPMIRVELPNRTLGLAFRHTKKTVIIPGVKSRRIPDRYSDRQTICDIYEFRDPKGDIRSDTFQIASFRTACIRPDNFEKEVGRKKSLAGALKMLKLSYEDREAIWKTYINRPRVQSTPPIDGEIIVQDTNEICTGA